ncbi:EAL domain-containing protein [Hydrogenimonas sp. SS33]|uniref:EAL domain-containing protein n=1 Tax=Hydrogenimonas leucolamina TaxID=2954236 RepID=UPI00336BDDE1
MRKAILEERIEAFPVESDKACAFSDALDFPESKMVCNELNICEYIRTTHQRLHELASTLFYLMTRKHYKSAYIIYNEVREFSERLLNLIGVLYFNAHIDRVQTFKNYIHHRIPELEHSFIAVLDIHSMKQINTFYNPKLGDRVIALVEHTLNTVYREHQRTMIYTKGVGGDFYLYFEESGIEEIEEVFRDIEREMQNRIADDPSLPVFNLKKGVIAVSPPFSLDKEDIRSVFIYLKERLKNADSPLFLISKRDQEEMLHWINNHYAHITHLKQLLDEDHVEIFLQPISRIHNPDNIHAFEVLARIREKEDYIPAGSFIDLLIDLQLIHRLDRLILDRIVHYRDVIPLFTSKLFINVSAHTLLYKEYVQELIDAIRGPLVGTEIILELTEQVLLDNLGLIVKLHEEHGLIFAIDDFGTGYSSLQTVINLAEKGIIQYLKFDGSLTQSMEESKSTKRIIQIASKMSHSLGLESIIECVETEKQRRELQEYGIEYAQGYFIGRPQSVEAWHMIRKEKGYL